MSKSNNHSRLKAHEAESHPTPGIIGLSWIDYIKTYCKSYYQELKNAGQLIPKAIQKENEYYEDVERLQASGKYPPGGAEEVARMFLYPKLYP